MQRNGNAKKIEPPVEPDRGTMPECWSGESLYSIVTRRIRMSKTMFGDRVKLALRQLPDEQWAMLRTPYLLVVPTMSRPATTAAPDGDLETLTNPRSLVLQAQLDGRGSEAEYMAADDIELAEKQLMACLLNWRPAEGYKPTIYGGMRVLQSRVPDVGVSYVFTFTEQIAAPDSVVGLDDPFADSGLLVPAWHVRVVTEECCVEDDQ